jgi:hypothetical protein
MNHLKNLMNNFIISNYVINLMISHNIFWQFILINICGLFLNIISSCLLYESSNGLTYLIYIYVFNDILFYIIDQYYIKIYNRNIANKIKCIFTDNSFKQYDKLSWDAKNKKTIDNFYQNMNRVSNAI